MKIIELFHFSPEFHGNTASDNRPDSPDRNIDKQTTACDVGGSEIDELKCNLMNQLNLIDDIDIQDHGLRDRDLRNQDLRDHHVIDTNLHMSGLRL